MSAQTIQNLVTSTADPAFAVDLLGSISAWNSAAADLFGLSEAQALGRPCHELLKGTDEGGVTCSDHCLIQQSLSKNRPVRNFDLQIETKGGREWCNVSILMVTDSRTESRHAIHLIHPREMLKRLELLVRDFLVAETELTPESARRLLASARVHSTAKVTLTARETEILRFLARGLATKTIADQLSISVKTVNNHITKIFAKLDAHTRFEAVRRAQRAGLV